MVYTFKQFKEDYLIEPNATDDDLIKKYGERYLLYCFNRGYESEHHPLLEPVCVAAIKGSQIITCTSCLRKDAPLQARYYSSIGYHVKTMTYDELAIFEDNMIKEIEAAEREMKYQEGYVYE